MFGTIYATVFNYEMSQNSFKLEKRVIEENNILSHIRAHVKDNTEIVLDE